MFLSIIIPVYNKEKYVSECLETVLKQDIEPEDYEILCVNDGSTDDSVRILREYEKQHSNLHVYNKENGGVSSARNYGLRHAAGDYIWFIDPDDFIASNCLAALREKCYTENCDWLVVGSYQFLDGDATQKMLQTDNANLEPNRINHGAIWNKIIKKEWIQKKQVCFDEHMTYAEDALFLHQLCYEPGMPYYSHVVYFYRLNDQSVTNAISQASRVARADSFIHFVKIIYQEKKETPKKNLNDKCFYILSMAIYYITDLPLFVRKQKLRELKKAGLFPYRRGKTCTVDQLYQTSRTDAFGRLFNYISTHATTRFGYARLLVLKRIIAMKHKIKKQ